jgi:toxin ParE1/3/4
MKRSVRVLRRAERDLQEIYDYLAREVPRRAAPVIDRLLTALDSLERLADRGAQPRDPILRARDFRFLVSAPYVVFYKVLARQVRIHRVLHGSRAYRDLL